MPIYAEKDMWHADFAEICEKCGNMRNTRQSYFRIKRTCLTNTCLISMHATILELSKDNI